MGLVAGLVAGILGMHALGSHGTPATATAVISHASPDPQAAHERALATGASHAEQEHGAASMPPMPPMPPAPPMASGPSREDADRSGNGLGSMVVLCAVMLAAAALGLLALLGTRVLRRVRLVRLARLAARVQPVRWARGTGPPPVWEFSVIRC